ncbi:MAG: hypothetical protein M3331_06165, partial [Actinomycetota bacterium]|nr:hypothetical protein [Actinomycetota bacterium]
VAGGKASALVSYSGGVVDGSRLVVALIEDEGDWKIDQRVRFQSLDRAAFEEALRDQLVDPELGFSSKGANCIVQRFGVLPRRELEQRLLNGGDQTFDRTSVACDRGAVEALVAIQLDEVPFYPASVVSCVEQELRRLSDERLAKVYVDGLVEFGRLILGCGRERVLEAYGSELEDSGYEASEVECLLDAFAGLSADEFARLTYDEDQFAELSDDCG